MSHSFTGSIEELKKIIEASGLEGDWKDETDKHTFKVKGKKRGVIIWYPSTMTLQFQGSEKIKAHNIQLYESANGQQNAGGAGEMSPTSKRNNSNSQQIFIVHGHDREAGHHSDGAHDADQTAGDAYLGLGDEVGHEALIGALREVGAELQAQEEHAIEHQQASRPECGAIPSGRLRAPPRIPRGRHRSLQRQTCA